MFNSYLLSLITFVQQRQKGSRGNMVNADGNIFYSITEQLLQTQQKIISMGSIQVISSILHCKVVKVFKVLIQLLCNAVRALSCSPASKERCNFICMTTPALRGQMEVLGKGALYHLCVHLTPELCRSCSVLTASQPLWFMLSTSIYPKMNVTDLTVCSSTP